VLSSNAPTQEQTEAGHQATYSGSVTRNDGWPEAADDGDGYNENHRQYGHPESIDTETVVLELLEVINRGLPDHGVDRLDLFMVQVR
jgi:hypothetical protein